MSFRGAPWAWVACGLAVFVLGCGGDDHGGSPDGGMDAASVDAARSDAAKRDGGPSTDAGAPDGSMLGDADVPGDGGTGPTPSFAQPVSLPDCDESDAETRMLTPEDDVESAINRADQRIFCITPGDYRDQGAISVTASGTSDARRYLRYYDPSTPDDLHPWNMADPETLPAKERVVLDGLRLEDADYWTIDRLRIHERRVVVREGSEHNVFNRLMIYRKPIWDKEASNIGGTVAISIRHSDYNTVQNSVIGKTEGGFPSGHGNDNIGVDIGGSDFVRVVGNEIFDMYNGDGVQVHRWGDDADRSKRTIIQANDFYLTEEFESEPVENAIDLKAGGAESGTGSVEGLPREEWTLVENNRIWNWDGSPDFTGPAIIFHFASTSGVIVRNNKIWGARKAAHSIIPKSDANNNHVVTDNVIYDSGGGLGPQHVEDSVFRRNILIAVRNTEDWPTWFWDPWDPARNNIVEHNVFIESDVGKPQLEDQGNEVSENAFYASEPFEGSNPDSVIEDGAEAAGHEALTIGIKRITDPQTVTIPHGRVSPDSPHAAWFSGEGAED